VAGVSAASTVDVPSGPASRLSRSEPTGAATKPGSGLVANRLTRTAPGAFTYPLTGEFLWQSPLYPKESCFTLIWQFSMRLWDNLNGTDDMA